MGVGWPESAERLIDCALAQIDHEGVRLPDSDTRETLDASGACRPGEGARLRLYQGFLRRSLESLPSAFGLHDRCGRRVHSPAGGFGPARTACLHATLTGATMLRGPAGGAADPPAGARLPLDPGTGVGAFDLTGCSPPPHDSSAAYGDLHRLLSNLIASPAPQLLRPRSPAVLAALGPFLSALRGSPTEAEARPYVVCEAVARTSDAWDGDACRTLAAAARLAIPVAPVPAPPAAGEALAEWTVRATVALVVALVVHRCHRRDAPVLWGVPLLQQHAPGPDALRALGLMLAAGRKLGLPTLVTVVAPPGGSPRAGELAPLWALQAAARGAGLVAWGGACEDGRVLDLGRLAEHARLVAEMRGVTADAPARGRSVAETEAGPAVGRPGAGGEARPPAGPRPDGNAPGVDPQVLAALAESVRAVAAAEDLDSAGSDEPRAAGHRAERRP